MGEVLENGVYLPDEGERNAYNGLKGNWNTVDTVVAQVQALSSTGLIRKPVDELPTEDIETNVIYMLKATKPNGDVYRIEYMYIDNHWDALGTSETTLDDYYTKAETDNLPAVKSGINATRVSNYDAHLANNDIHVTLANKQSWDGKQNALDTNQTAAVNSGVTAAKVTGYDAHVSDADVHVTASDKTAWNAKQDGLSQTQLAAVNSGITEAKRTGYDNHIADTDVHVTTADKAAWNGKQNALTQTQLDNIAAVPDKANSADLATVATSGSYTDLINAPTIPTVNNATLTIQKNGTDVATFTANASSNVTANLSIPVNTSDLNNDAGFLTQHNPVDDELSTTSVNALQNKVVKSELDGKAPLVHTHAASDVTSGTFNIARIPNLDASKITSGTIDIARLPKGALERLVKVANQTARYALTTDDVQLGDTVQQLDTGVMYVVTDETKLDSADGYTEFTAGAASSVPWTGVTGKPNDYPPSSHTHTKSQITDFPTLATVATSGSYNDLSNIPASFTPSSHTHGNVTNDGKLPTASRALISDSSKNITVSSVTDTELGYLSGVTSSVQTQLNGKAASNHVHGNITNDGKVGTTADKPLITGTGGVVQAGSFGNAANTFCEGNDSRLSDARTPVAHTHGKSDITDLFNSANTWSAEQTITNNFHSVKETNYELGQSYPNGNHLSGLRIKDKNGSNVGLLDIVDRNYGNMEMRIRVQQKFDPNSNNRSTSGDILYNEMILGITPTKTNYLGVNADLWGNNTYNLGTAFSQWKSVYAQSYYYNGTAWGLDKENVWGDSNRFTKSINLGSITSYTDCTLGFTGLYNNLFFNTRGSSNITSYGTYVYYGYSNASSDRGGVIRMVRTTDKRGDTNDGYIPDLSFNLYKISPAKLFIDFMEAVRVTNDGTENSLKPITNNATDLGTSDNQWKSLNGINPGALSLPDYSKSMNVDTTRWSTNAGRINYTPTINGWLQIAIPNDIDNNNEKSNFITIMDTDIPNTGFNNPSGLSAGNSNDYRIQITFPVVANKTYYIYIKSYSGNIYAVKYIAALGHI